MKKILTITALCGIFAVPAGAVQKCVALDVDVIPTEVLYTEGLADWSVVYPDVTIRGIAVCSNISADEHSTSNTLEYSTYNAELNSECWCRMISPAVSLWVYTTSQDDGAYCAETCPRICANRTKNMTGFRASLFSNLNN